MFKITDLQLVTSLHVTIRYTDPTQTKTHNCTKQSRYTHKTFFIVYVEKLQR